MISRGRASTAASLSCPHLITSAIKSACPCQISRCSRGAGKRGGAPKAPPGAPGTRDLSGWRVSPHHHARELPRCSKGKTIFPEHLGAAKPTNPEPSIPSLLAVLAEVNLGAHGPYGRGHGHCLGSLWGQTARAQGPSAEAALKSICINGETWPPKHPRDPSERSHSGGIPSAPFSRRKSHKHHEIFFLWLPCLDRASFPE